METIEVPYQLSPPCSIFQSFVLEGQHYFLAQELAPEFQIDATTREKSVRALHPTGCYFLGTPLRSEGITEYNVICRFAPSRNGPS